VYKPCNLLPNVLTRLKHKSPKVSFFHFDLRSVSKAISAEPSIISRLTANQRDQYNWPIDLSVADDDKTTFYCLR